MNKSQNSTNFTSTLGESWKLGRFEPLWDDLFRLPPALTGILASSCVILCGSGENVRKKMGTAVVFVVNLALADLGIVKITEFLLFIIHTPIRIAYISVNCLLMVATSSFHYFGRFFDMSTNRHICTIQLSSLSVGTQMSYFALAVACLSRWYVGSF